MNYITEVKRASNGCVDYVKAVWKDVLFIIWPDTKGKKELVVYRTYLYANKIYGEPKVPAEIYSQLMRQAMVIVAQGEKKARRY